MSDGGVDGSPDEVVAGGPSSTANLPPTGQWEVTIATYGRRLTDRGEVFLNHHLYAEPDAPIGMDYFVWVIRNSERTILVDTGFSAAGGAARKRTTLIPPMEAFAALGITPESAPPIVITHAHYDHAGNIGHFPKSQVVIAKNEYDFWTSSHSKRTQFHHSIEDAEIDDLAVVAAEGRMTTFSGRHEVAPGIEVIEVGGHTPGQSIVTVATSDGTVLLASDALHYYEEFDRDMPFTYVADLIGMYEAFDVIRELGEDGAYSHLVAGHDPSTLERFSAVTDGPLAGLAATIGGAQ